MDMKALFQAIDRKDTEGFVSFLTDDAEFVYANIEPVYGKDDIRKFVDQFFSSIKGLSHEILTQTVEQDRIVVEGTVTYIRNDGSTLQIPFADVFELEGRKIKSYRIYLDSSDLFTP